LFQGPKSRCLAGAKAGGSGSSVVKPTAPKLAWAGSTATLGCDEWCCKRFVRAPFAPSSWSWRGKPIVPRCRRMACPVRCCSLRSPQSAWRPSVNWPSRASAEIGIEPPLPETLARAFRFSEMRLTRSHRGPGVWSGGSRPVAVTTLVELVMRHPICREEALTALMRGGLTDPARTLRELGAQGPEKAVTQGGRFWCAVKGGYAPEKFRTARNGDPR